MVFPELRGLVTFKVLNLLHSWNFKNKFDIIFCRNVLIYFDKDLKNKIFDLFKESLDSYGFLVLGESESLSKNEKYLTIDEKNKIYKRKK